MTDNAQGSDEQQNKDQRDNEHTPDTPRADDTSGTRRDADIRDSAEHVAATTPAVEHWAKVIGTLSVSNVPQGAMNLNVEGRRLASPIQGFGRMWQKTYQLALPGELISPPDLIALWKREFPRFWPGGNRFYAPLTGLRPGDVAVLNLTMPAHVKLSTGVMVLYADEESFTLMTPEGHMFAGWIAFSATDRDGDTLARVQVLMRASDPLFELGLMLGGHGMEDRFWQQTLENLATHLGEHNARADTHTVCVDKKRQWSRWTNIKHSSAIHSTLHLLAAPLRRRGGARGRNGG